MLHFFRDKPQLERVALSSLVLLRLLKASEALLINRSYLTVKTVHSHLQMITYW